MASPDHPLAKTVLRALVVCRGERARGRVRELTPGGRLVLDTSAPAEPGAPLRLWLEAADATRRIDGIVSSREGSRIAGDLRMSATDRDAVARLLVAAGDGEALEEVRIQIGRGGAIAAAAPDAARPTGSPARPEGAADLARRWSQVRGALDDAAAHAAFLGDCARRDRLDFAVACYRQLQAERPDDERVARYLRQAATVVSFAAMPPSTRDGAVGSRRVRLLLGLFLAASAVLALIALVIAVL